MTSRISSRSLEQTLSIAHRIGHALQGGEVIELLSDLGGGKTTFVRGLASGMGSTDRVSSPSFTLTNQYRAEVLTMYHFDFYRLDEPGIMRDELTEVLADVQSVTVVEWATIVDHVLPDDRLRITLRATAETGRELCFEYPHRLAYLLEGIA